MRINRLFERYPSSWAWRLLLGPASILDGIVYTLSLSFLDLGAKLWVSRQLAKSRLDSIMNS